MQQWHNDINDMHSKYGVHDWIKEELNREDKDWSRLNKFLQFRINFLKEDYQFTWLKQYMENNIGKYKKDININCVAYLLSRVK